MENNTFFSFEDITCPLGCKKNDDIVCTGRDLLHNLPGEFTVVKCRTCGLLRTNPRPTPDTIGFYYPDEYGPYIGTQVVEALQHKSSWIRRLLKRIAKKVLKFETSNLPTLVPGRMLELGCASGSFLHQMAGQGWQVQGIEFSEKAAQAASQLGYHVHAGPLETAPAPKEPFDLIVGWMVLEHLHEPIRCLKNLREWSKSDTLLVLSVPNAGSFEFSFFKDKWYALQLPTHLYHFTPQTLKQLLCTGGWEIEKIFYQRNLNNLVASIGHLLDANGFARLGRVLINYPTQTGRWGYLLYPLAYVLSRINHAGRITVWARPLANSKTCS